MGHPPQMVIDWIALAVRHIEATSGIGCPTCEGGTPTDAAKRGHDRHPQDCKRSLERRFAALDMQTFLLAPAECWFGLPCAPETTEAVES